jgi:hypothetical protein
VQLALRFLLDAVDEAFLFFYVKFSENENKRLDHNPVVV